MKITFLGTGPSKRIPRPNCKWYVCEEAKKPGSKSARLQTSTFLKFANTGIIIDITQDFEKQVKLLGKEKIDHIFLTHGHADAAGGLKQLHQYDKKFGIPTIYTEKNTRDVLIEDLSWADFPYQEIKPYKKIAFNNFSVIPFRVEHAFNPKFLTLGYLFEINKKNIVYASDFKKIPAKSKNLIKGADIAILDCAAYKNPIPTHQSFPEILALSKELKFKKIYLTQVGIAWPHYEMAQKIVSKQAKNIFSAYDGLKINL